MELILKSNNKESLAKIMALAKKLNVIIEKKTTDADGGSKEAIRDRILKFDASTASSFGDAGTWQNNEREDRELPFS